MDKSPIPLKVKIPDEVVDSDDERHLKEVGIAT
jgi:hypothetical protein